MGVRAGIWCIILFTHNGSNKYTDSDAFVDSAGMQLSTGTYTGPNQLTANQAWWGVFEIVDSK